jgi:exopolysaccharide biosynthesis predicted pyruvyltransferase EpsI
MCAAGAIDDCGETVNPGPVDRPGTLEDVFRQHCDRPWIFVRPGGNWGDHLIYAGAELLARKCNLRWTSHDAATFAQARTGDAHGIYLHGGGGYNTWGTGRPFELLRDAISRGVAIVVQGPQTLEGRPERIRIRFAEALHEIRARRIVFFARERRSLEVLHDLALGGVELALDHDSAFHLDQTTVLELAGLDRVPAARYDLTAYRDDDEQRVDASGARARGVILDPAYAAGTFAHWLRIHLFARTLLTNRLHSGIAGALLGKPVTIAPGAYHKNRSIWEFSLAQRGVQWTDGIQVGFRLWECVPRKLRESYKVRKLLLMLQRVPTR